MRMKKMKNKNKNNKRKNSNNQGTHHKKASRKGITKRRAKRVQTG